MDCKGYKILAEVGDLRTGSLVDHYLIEVEA